MVLPTEYRDSWAKFPLTSPRSDDAKVHSGEPFKEGTKGRLYFLSPHSHPEAVLHPGAVDAIVWRIDRDGVVFRLTGPPIAPPPLDTIPSARQVRLSGSWLWTWESPQP